MKVGFFLKWPKGNSSVLGCNVIGDELYAESMCRVLSTSESVESAEIFAPNHIPKEEQDVMIYLNDTFPKTNWAKKHILYIQNAYGEGSDKALEKFHKSDYDGYAFISNRLLEIHQKAGFQGLFLPFGVDTDLFYPRQKDDIYNFDVAYIGNDIKGTVNTTKYLYPAVHYNFGLYGNWSDPNPSLWRKLQFWKPRTEPSLIRKLQFWNPITNIPAYKTEFFKISRGKIPQDDVPILYSSAKINLNCTHQDCIDWDVITLRTFEVLACQGFLITDKVPIAEKTMQGCMVFTDGNNDLSEKIDYYIDHEKERDSIAKKGYEYTIRYASLDSRMNEFLTYLREIL